MTKKIGLFGYPLSHSISPVFQQAALDYCSLDVIYKVWPVEPANLQTEVDKLRSMDYLGAGITIPYKEKVMPFLDVVDPFASRVGAVNTIVNDGGRLIGHNTDVYGFMQGLTETAKFSPMGKRVLVVGAGGAARAGIFGLIQSGVSMISIANRTKERALQIVEQFVDEEVEMEVVRSDRYELDSVVKNSDLVVNATSVGMRNSASENDVPFETGSISPSSLVYDMVYTPRDTPFLVLAKEAGADTLGGLPMLIYQGSKSFSMWTGVDAPINIMFDAANDVL